MTRNYEDEPNLFEPGRSEYIGYRSCMQARYSINLLRLNPEAIEDLRKSREGINPRELDLFSNLN